MELTSDTITVKNLDHLGLVCGTIDSLGLVEEIDRLIPSERKVSHGMMIKALILNSMGFSQHALYITPKFFERCPVKHLLGASYEAEDFNDDSVGRCLDGLFSYGLNKLFVQLAHKACERAGIDTKYWHVDSTNFSVEGNYADEQGGVKISRGFAKDKRFDLKQVTLGLITSYKTAIPRYMQAFDGNANDKQTLVTMIETFIGCFEAGEDLGIFISDAGIYSADNIISAPMKATGWITRIPETIGLVKEWIENTQLSDLQEFTNIPGYRYRAVPSLYAGVEQRWFVIESAPLAHAVTKTMNEKAQTQIGSVKAKIAKKATQWFREQTELAAWVAQLEQKHPLVHITYTLKEQFYYCKPGKPKLENCRIEYQVDTCTITVNDEAIAPIVTQKSRFVLGTNVLDVLKLPDEEVLAAYKTQATSVENGFKFLKDPIFFAESFFVKKTSRLEGLLMIMTLSLLVYSLCERNLHNALEEKNEFVDTQNSKKTQKPTMRLVFNQFRGIHCVSVNNSTTTFCTNLNNNHKKIIRLLGPIVAKYYFLEI
jgi:transposase